MTERLFQFCEMPDVFDRRAFLAAVICIFAEFPLVVMEEVADPARGLPSRVKRPTLVDVRKACEEAYGPIARQMERDRVIRDRAHLLPPPPGEPKPSLAELEAKWGSKFAPREKSVSPPDSEHAQRVLADIEARKVGRTEGEGGQA